MSLWLLINHVNVVTDKQCVSGYCYW